LILFNFNWENGSMITSSFHTIAPNILKPSRWTSYSSRAFWRYQECGMKCCGLWSVACVVGSSVNPFQNRKNSTYENCFVTFWVN
jgi:hypothetical protein